MNSNSKLAIIFLFQWKGTQCGVKWALWFNALIFKILNWSASNLQWRKRHLFWKKSLSLEKNHLRLRKNLPWREKKSSLKVSFCEKSVPRKMVPFCAKKNTQKIKFVVYFKKFGLSSVIRVLCQSNLTLICDFVGLLLNMHRACVCLKRVLLLSNKPQTKLPFQPYHTGPI